MVIELIPVAGGEPHEILSVEKPEYIYGGLHRKVLAWTPDGRYLLFGKARSGDEDQTVELWRIPVEGGEPRNLGLAMPNLRDLRIHPDGQRIAFTAGKFDAEVWVMEDFLPEHEGTR